MLDLWPALIPWVGDYDLRSPKLRCELASLPPVCRDGAWPPSRPGANNRREESRYTPPHGDGGERTDAPVCDSIPPGVDTTRRNIEIIINGLLVTYGRLQPIIVTIATLAIWQGVALLVLPQQGGAIPPGFTNLLAGNIGIVPSSLVIFILLILLWQVLRRTRFLVTLYAIGNDERAARANGVPVNLAKIRAYTVGGLFSGAAGLYLAAVATSGDATSGTPLTLTSIAAVVLGGVSLFGGRGSAVGSLVGACILTLLLNVLFFAGINPQLQEFFQGLFLILAVVASTLVRRFLQSER